MKIRSLILGALLCFTASTTQAAVIFSVEDDMPGALTALQSERASWAAGLGALVSEGFEGTFSVSNSIDFGSFVVSITGSSLNLYTGSNALTRTEGNQSLGFSGSALLTFTFTNNISAFAIDWSSLEGTRSSIDYTDSEGNSYTDIFSSPNSITAGFFGITGVNLSSVTFDITSSEILEFDFIQFQLAEARPVPAPHIMSLVLIGFALLLTRKTKKNV